MIQPVWVISQQCFILCETCTLVSIICKPDCSDIGPVWCGQEVVPKGFVAFLWSSISECKVKGKVGGLLGIHFREMQ
jgi:hypothetical protein